MLQRSTMLASMWKHNAEFNRNTNMSNPITFHGLIDKRGKSGSDTAHSSASLNLQCGFEAMVFLWTIGKVAQIVIIMQYQLNKRGREKWGKNLAKSHIWYKNPSNLWCIDSFLRNCPPVFRRPLLLKTVYLTFIKWL